MPAIIAQPDPAAPVIVDLADQIATLQATTAAQAASLADLQARLDLATGKMDSDLSDLNQKIATHQQAVSDLTARRDALAARLAAAKTPAPQTRSQF